MLCEYALARPDGKEWDLGDMRIKYFCEGSGVICGFPKTAESGGISQDINGNDCECVQKAPTRIGQRKGYRSQGRDMANRILKEGRERDEQKIMDQ